MAKSEYDKKEEARIAKALSESNMLDKDIMPEKEISSIEEIRNQGVKDSAGRMLSALKDLKTRDEAKAVIFKNNPDVKKEDADKLIIEVMVENNKKKKMMKGGLTGGQKELDKNNDGDITGEDFAMLREGKQDGGMLMDDQMTNMMQTEETPDMENQMADMMSPVAETAEEELQEQQAIEESQVPDEMMEDNYLDFLIDEALDENEEEMLMQELEANPQLSMLFDKVMEVAMEFSGSGPVDGPGSEVSDSIPARLSDGEFVFTAKAVDVIGADNLMSMMKQAEAQAEERQLAANGGEIEEETGLTPMPVETPAVRQDIRVTKETVGSQAAMQEESDLVDDELKKSMLSTRPYVRS